MDRRVLLASIVLIAGGTAGIGVAVFAFVGLEDATNTAEVLWESEPAAGGDGSDAVIAAVDGETYLLQPMTEGGDPAIRAIDATGDTVWTVPLAEDVVAGERSGLVVAEIDADPVVAFTTGGGALVVLDARDGTERFTASMGAGSGYKPATADLSGDGTVEFVVVTADGTAVGIDSTGSTRFETTLDGDGSMEPLAVEAEQDMNADAERTLQGPGVAVLTEAVNGQQVTVLDAAGTPVWSEPVSGTALNWNAATTRRGDTLTLGLASGSVTTLEATDGAVRYEVGLQDAPVDVGGSDAGRLHVGGIGDVWAVDLLDGEVVWKQQYGGDTRVNAPRVGDVTGDGTTEIVVVNRAGEVLAMNRNGEPVIRGNVGEVIVYTSPLLADVTGDGRSEILVVTEDGTVVALSEPEHQSPPS